ncbi:MAG: hypothetical protein WD490_07935 [Opitutales bacterium]
MTSPASILISGTERSTSQPMRFPPALDPASAPLDGRTDEELIAFAREFAEGLAFWHMDDQLGPHGVWPKFLPDLRARGLAEIKREAALSPQKTLVLAFLQLYEKARGELNRVTGRHLDFYYRQVLGLEPDGPQPDRAHLVLALKKTATEVLLPRGAVFSTKTGLPYETDLEVAVNRAELLHRRVLARDPETGRLRYAVEGASSDGLGEPLSEEDPAWHPFGHTHQLPQASLGFALSSPVLLMREGDRTITVHLTLDNISTPPGSEELVASLTGLISGEKEWLPADTISAEVSEDSEGPVHISLTFTMDAGLGAVVPYDPTVLDGGFDTLAPVLKIMLLDSAPDDLADKLSSARVNSVRMEVEVAGMKDLLLENDHGRVDPSKVFMPFGPLPKAGGSFYINAGEALTKDVSSVNLQLEWNNPPEKLKDHYTGYTDRSGKTVDSNAYVTADLEILREGKFESLRSNTPLFADNASLVRTIDSTKDDAALKKPGPVVSRLPAGLSVKAVKSAHVRMAFSSMPVTKPLSTIQPAPTLAYKQPFLLPAKVILTQLRPESREGFLRLRLKKDFLHDRFSLLFASAVAFNQTEAGQEDPRPVPNPPYTPELASLRLGYTAQSETCHPNATDAGGFDSRDIRLFHLTPFGQREEHRHIKDRVFASSREVTLFPAIGNTGELYLGLKNLEPRNSVSLLFAFLEGSANPLATRQKVTWSVLCFNHWKPLETEEILAETTHDFLASGVVRVLLPVATSTGNTLLEPGLVWLRAAVNGDITAVCRLLDIHPNAVPVTLADPHEAKHLESSLVAKSISIAPPSLRALKEVVQPYASFGGAASESARSFHTRTSERLRHRGRAVTAWDFERLVLERFPKIYRALCLPHTNRGLKSVPGCVTLVLIADTRQNNQANSLRPLTDLATLAKVEQFLSSIHTPFANAAAINPVFEPLKLCFNVKFTEGKPFATYLPILQQDLKAWLSPWAADGSTLPDFGGGVLRSSILAFIESLPYVDYLTDLILVPPTPHGDPAHIHEVHPSTAASIITSASRHEINPV